MPLYCNSPGSEGSTRRWLHQSYTGVLPMLHEKLEEMLVTVGHATVSARTASVGVSFFAARALRAVELRLMHCHRVHRSDDGGALLPVSPKLQIASDPPSFVFRSCNA